MYLTSADYSSVKLTVDKTGVVWYLDGEQMPFSSNLSVDDFLGSTEFSQLPKVRVVATTRNVPLILSIYRSIIDRDDRSLEVCSPLCCVGTDRDDPGLTLYRMRGHGLPPSLGGWHRFGPLDLPSYLLASRFNPACATQEPIEPEVIGRILRSHPAWPALQFIDHLDEDALVRVIAVVIDPRWFVDPLDPHNPSRLEHFFGLSFKGKNDADRGDVSRRTDRFRLLVRAWSHSGEFDAADLGPRQFVRRAAVGHSQARGELRASKTFLDFLRQVWIGSLCVGPQASRLFVPEYFFDSVADADAFTRHVASRNKAR